jgi:sterol O-acyltransferase
MGDGSGGMQRALFSWLHERIFFQFFFSFPFFHLTSGTSLELIDCVFSVLSTTFSSRKMRQRHVGKPVDSSRLTTSSVPPSPSKVLPQSLRIEIDTAIDDTLDEFRGKLHNIVHQQMEHFIASQKEFEENAKKNKWKTDKKVFEPRETLLTTIFEQEHFRTIYHIFLAFLMLYAFSTFLSDVMEGRLFIDLSLIWRTLDKPHFFLGIWVLLVSITALYAWIVSVTIKRMRKWPKLFWSVYLVYQVVFYLMPGYFTWTWKLPPGSALIVLIETIRIAMKVHAFSYEAMYSPEEKVSLGCFAYFFVAPTLVYRSKYPMTRRISWGSACKHLMNLIFCVIYCFFLFDRFFIPHFEKYGIEEKERPLRLLYVAFECAIPGTMIFMLGFFGVLHSWFNFFAELCQFADRDFYSDWWNATNWPSYFRRWNGVVHDFIYWYLFQPFQRTFKLNRSASMAIAFLLSALVHEYVMMIVFRFFFPVCTSFINFY